MQTQTSSKVSTNSVNVSSLETSSSEAKNHTLVLVQKLLYAKYG